MITPDRLQRAVHRLTGALDNLELAAARRAEIEAARGDIDQEFAVMQDDRSRLAVELDAALARSRTLDRTAEEVAGRLQRAGATVRTILAELSAGEDPAGEDSAGETDPGDTAGAPPGPD
jgi:hypothetical protein